MGAKYDVDSLAKPIDATPAAGDAEAGRSLLQEIAENPDGAAARVLRDWDESTILWKSLFAQWKINRARLAGYTGMRLVKVQNENRAFFPQGSVPSQTTTNKAARLARRLRATLFTDQAIPDAVAVSDDDTDRDAAETATRVLNDICNNHNLAYNLVCGDAFDSASSHGSGFLRFWIDQTGGGRDQETGQWLPWVRREVLTGRNGRLIPDSATDVGEGTGAAVGALV